MTTYAQNLINATIGECKKNVQVGRQMYGDDAATRLRLTAAKQRKLERLARCHAHATPDRHTTPRA